MSKEIIEQDRDYSADCVEIVQAEYDAYKEKHKWHKYPDERPNHLDDYLVQLNDKELMVLAYKDDGYWYAITDNIYSVPYDNAHIVAWMELPKPYKEN